MRKIKLFFGCLLLPVVLQAQYITGIASRWNDDLTEWDIYLENDEEEASGELKMRWQLKGDWSEWEYRLGEESGTIKLKWKNDPREWVIRGYNETVTARMLWSDDIREWRITNNSTSLTLKTRWGNNAEEWMIRDRNYGDWQIYTRWEGDPREWVIEDGLDEAISPEMRMALLFIALFHSIPKG